MGIAVFSRRFECEVEVEVAHRSKRVLLRFRRIISMRYIFLRRFRNCEECEVSDKGQQARYCRSINQSRIYSRERTDRMNRSSALSCKIARESLSFLIWRSL